MKMRLLLQAISLLFMAFLIAWYSSLRAQTATQTNPTTGDSVAYTPKDVPDAVRVLKDSLTKDELDQIQDPSNVNNFFVEVGLRNSWGLWKNSRLAQWCVSQGVEAPEDMTGIIVDALRADLNKPVFDGQLIESQNPDTPQLSQGWTLASNGDETKQPFASVGLLLRPDGALDVMGPNGLFRVAGDTVTPLLVFTNTTQNIPKNKDDDGLMDWALDPTHFLPLDHEAYLIGSHWEGVYLLAKDSGGIYHFTLLDGKIGADMTPSEMEGHPGK